MKSLKPRPLWPLLTAALIGLPVLYVLSYGAWINWANVERPFRRPRWVENAGVRLYRPITISAKRSLVFRGAVDWYLNLWDDSSFIDWDYNPKDPERDSR
jgi:hypothetical protein